MGTIKITATNATVTADYADAAGTDEPVPSGDTLSFEQCDANGTPVATPNFTLGAPTVDAAGTGFTSSIGPTAAGKTLRIKATDANPAIGSVVSTPFDITAPTPNQPTHLVIKVTVGT